MKIVDVSVSKKQNFGNLYYSNTIVRKIGTPKFNRELAKIRTIITENKLDKKRYVDIYLGYDQEKGFYGVISSKKQGIPNNPDSKSYISTSKNSVRKFKEWLRQWNFDYSPKGIAQWVKTKEEALKILERKK